MPDFTNEVVDALPAALPGVVAAVEGKDLHERLAGLEAAVEAILEHLGNQALIDKAKAKA